MTPLAVSRGARLIKEPYKTYYNWYQSVLLTLRRMCSASTKCFERAAR